MGASPASDRFALLYELSRAFSERLELEDLLPVVLERTKEVFRAEGAAILLLDGGELYFPVTSNVSARVDDRLRQLRFPADQGIAGAVLREGKALLVPDVADDERFYAEVDRSTGTRTRDLMCAPLRTRAGAIGAVEVLNHLRGGFAQEDLEFLEVLSGSIAIALENAKLYGITRESEARLRGEVDALRREKPHDLRFPEIVGKSAAMERVFSLMESAIPSPISVLIEGETGAGKEAIARAIHGQGPRGEEPFVAVNCGALPETLLESELFGFRRGAFTGADADKVGLFEAADGGTLFLDEIGETTPRMQVELLRVLEEGEIRRVGDTQTRRVDVRIISATNRDLEQEVAEKRFREDLYYRISVFPIRVPPLRERAEDVPLLAARFLSRSCERLGKRVDGIAPDAVELLGRYAWPGNIRQLENEIERAVALTAARGRIEVASLSERVRSPNRVSVAMPSSDSTLKDARLAFEREYVAEVLERHGGNATQAAEALGLSRQMLQRKIKQYGLREG